MNVEIRFIGASEKGRDKRLVDYTRECRDLSEAERWARTVLAKSHPEERTSVKRLAFVVDVEPAESFALPTPSVPTYG